MRQLSEYFRRAREKKDFGEEETDRRICAYQGFLRLRGGSASSSAYERAANSGGERLARRLLHKANDASLPNFYNSGRCVQRGDPGTGRRSRPTPRHQGDSTVSNGTAESGRGEEIPGDLECLDLHILRVGFALRPQISGVLE